MSYQVLARKYRPAKLEDLRGQEVLVRTLSNAIKSDKLVHAFILTGIRGIGKTTTARIIAKAINCKEREGTEPCCKCENCLKITKSSHQDVLEIDAASRTSVEGIREIIENIGYSPVIAKYRVYIIDEVHMLSKSAFNALLKTLEEPPEYVKFIFATTEIQKIPLTILSRCQRFDLRRLNCVELSDHLKVILGKEEYEADDEAISLIADAAEGSVRDALSLLDQALSCNNYEKHLSTNTVSQMLGLSHKFQLYNLFEYIVSGDVEKATETLGAIYESSSSMGLILEELMKINHHITMSKSVKGYIDMLNLPSNHVEKIRNMSEQLSIPSLSKIWQMLLKGNSEMRLSFDHKSALEMLIIRMAYSSAMPNPIDIISKAEKNDKTDDKDIQSVLNMFNDAKIVN